MTYQMGDFEVQTSNGIVPRIIETGPPPIDDPRMLPLQPDWRMTHVEQGDRALWQAEKSASEGYTERGTAWASIAQAHYLAASLRKTNA